MAEPTSTTKVRIFICWARPERASELEVMKYNVSSLKKELDEVLASGLESHDVDVDIILDLEREERGEVTFAHELRTHARKCDIALIICSFHLRNKLKPPIRSRQGWIVTNELIPLQARHDKDENDLERVWIYPIPFDGISHRDLNCKNPVFNLFRGDRPGGTGPAVFLDRFPGSKEEVNTSELGEWVSSNLAGRLRERINKILAQKQALGTVPSRFLMEGGGGAHDYVIEALWRLGEGEQYRPLSPHEVERWQELSGMAHEGHGSEDHISDFFWQKVSELSEFNRERDEGTPVIVFETRGPTVEDCKGFHLNRKVVESTDEVPASATKQTGGVQKGGTPRASREEVRTWIEANIAPGEVVTKPLLEKRMGKSSYLLWLEQMVDEGSLERVDGAKVQSEVSRGRGRPPACFRRVRKEQSEGPLRSENPIPLEPERRSLEEWIGERAETSPSFTRREASAELGFEVPHHWLTALVDTGVLIRTETSKKNRPRGKSKGRPPIQYAVRSAPNSASGSTHPAAFKAVSEILVPGSLTPSQEKVIKALADLAPPGSSGWVQGLDRIADRADISYQGASNALGELRRLSPPLVIAAGETRQRRFRLNLEHYLGELNPDEEVKRSPDYVEEGEVDSFQSERTSSAVPTSLNRLLEACKSEDQRNIVNILYNETIDRAEGIDSLGHLELKDLAELRMSRHSFYTALDVLLFSSPPLVVEINTSTARRYSLNL